MPIFRDLNISTISQHFFFIEKPLFKPEKITKALNKLNISSSCKIVVFS